jgi:hypothetical protein
VEHGKRKGRGEGGDGNQEEGVGFAGTLAADGGRACCRQARVAGLADLDRAVIDELSHDQAGGRADDGQADRPLRCQHGAAPSRRASRKGGAPQQGSFEQAEATEENLDHRPHPPAKGQYLAAGPRQRRPDALQLPIDGAI